MQHQQTQLLYCNWSRSSVRRQVCVILRGIRSVGCALERDVGLMCNAQSRSRTKAEIIIKETKGTKRDWVHFILLHCLATDIKIVILSGLGTAKPNHHTVK